MSASISDFQQTKRRREREQREDQIREHVDLYRKNISAWYGDLFRAGMNDFKIEVHPHSCQSGVWFEISWVRKGEKAYYSAMWQKLVFERAIRASLSFLDEPDELI